MAKKRAASGSTASVAAVVSTTSGIRVVQVPPGGTAEVIVDVGQMTVPYTVTYAGKVVIKSLVDRAQDLNLLPGDQILGWAFSHMVKDWHHKIGVSVNGSSPIVLESLSEAKKDQDHSVNFAVIRS